MAKSQAGSCRSVLSKDELEIKTKSPHFAVSMWNIIVPCGEFSGCGGKVRLTREDAARRDKRKTQHEAKNRESNEPRRDKENQHNRMQTAARTRFQQMRRKKRGERRLFQVSIYSY